MDDIVARFYSQSCNCMFINADECSSFGGAYRQNNKLKKLVTSITRKLENKGLDAVKINNFTTDLFTTNSDKPVKVELSDRRFVIVDTQHENKPDHNTFKRLHQLIQKGASWHLLQLSYAEGPKPLSSREEQADHSSRTGDDVRPNSDSFALHAQMQ